MTRARLAAIGLALAALALACRAPAPAAPRLENRPSGPLDPGAAVIGVPNQRLTARSIADLLSWRFAAQLDAGTFVAEYNGTEDDLLDELEKMGVHDLHQLAALIPPDFDHRGAGEFILEDPANIPGLVRDFLMIHDAERYFRVAWQERWQSILPANVSALRAYVDDFQPFYDARVLTPEEVADAPYPDGAPARP